MLTGWPVCPLAVVQTARDPAGILEGVASGWGAGARATGTEEVVSTHILLMPQALSG